VYNFHVKFNLYTYNYHVNVKIWWTLKVHRFQGYFCIKLLFKSLIIVFKIEILLYIANCVSLCIIYMFIICRICIWFFIIRSLKIVFDIINKNSKCFFRILFLVGCSKCQQLRWENFSQSQLHIYSSRSQYNAFGSWFWKPRYFVAVFGEMRGWLYQQANFNETWYKSPLGKGDYKLLK
jgi:hypothetical protein